MQEKKRSRSKLQSYFGIFITGGGIGWLIGLSVSAVVSIVITSVAGTAAAIIAAMSGIEQKVAATEPSKKDEKPQALRDINPWPLAFLVMGLIVGSILGILARNNHLLGSDISTELKSWSKAGLTQPGGLTEQEILLKLFEAQISRDLSSYGTKVSQSSIPPAGTVLFTVSADECGTLRKALLRSDEELKQALNRIERLKNLSSIVGESETLKNIVEQVLCPLN